MTEVTSRDHEAPWFPRPQRRKELGSLSRNYSYLTWFCTLFVVLNNFYVVSYIFYLFSQTYSLCHLLTNQASYIFSYNLRIPFVVYVIWSFSHFIVTMTEISAASPNEEEQEQEISIIEFMRTQKQLIENMQLMFQKHATATSTPQSN